MKGVSAWEVLFEKVLVPATGLGGVMYAAVGGPVPLALYPVLVTMIGFPVIKTLDRIRRNGNNR